MLVGAFCFCTLVVRIVQITPGQQPDLALAQDLVRALELHAQALGVVLVYADASGERNEAQQSASRAVFVIEIHD